MLNLQTIQEASTASIVTLQIGEIPESKRNLKAFVLSLETKENKWNAGLTAAVRKAIKYARDHSEASILVTRSSTPKFFSYGLDLQGLDLKNTSAIDALGKDVMSAVAELLELPIPTICVIQGHAFGAGMMFAFAHDYRIQQSSKGFMCANQIEVNVPIPKPELELLLHSLAPIDFFETVLGAKRWDGEESYRRGLVHATGGEREIESALIALCNRVAHLGLNRKTMDKFKRETKGNLMDGLKSFAESKL